MTTRSIKAVLELDSNRYIAGMGRAKTATRDFSASARRDFDQTRSGFDGMGSSVAGGGKYTAGLSRAKAATKDFARSAMNSTEQQRHAWDQMGNTALIAGGAIAGGLGLATREAINWESAWAGVTKTTEGTPAQMAELEQELRGLTKVLPATHEEIAGVAEAAGQLGIAREDLIGFTETAIALGESTNLSADEAAEGLAKISNVMGTSAREGVAGYEKLGNVLVALGNDGASTERDIVSMAQRLTGASKIAGITEGELLALSNAMSSVGIESELGGGAMSRAILEMQSAVRGGGGTLDTFAETAGMSAKQFAAAWEKDPVTALQSFVVGLAKVNDEGGDVKEVLKDAGLAGTQNAQVLLRLAGASDVLTDSLELQAKEWENGTALSDEATKRYETDASRLQIAQNSARDAAIDFGSSLAPMAATLAGYVAGAADSFVKLPEPIQDATAAAATLTAGTLLLAGGFTRATTSVIAFRAAAETAGVSSAALAGTAKTLGKALAVVGVAWGATEAKEYIKTQHLASITNGEMAKGLYELADGGKAAAAGLDEMYRQGDGKWYQIFGDDEGPLSTAEALDRFALSADAAFSQDLASKADRFLDSSKLQKFSDEAAILDETLAQMVRDGNADQAAAALDQLLSGVDPAIVDKVRESFTQYNDELKNSESAAWKAGDALGGMDEGLDGNADGFIDATEAAEGYVQELDELADAITKMGGGFRAEQQTLADFDESVASAKKAISGTQDEQEAALRGIASSALEVAGAQLEVGRGADVISDSMTRARSRFLAVAESMGYSKGYANDLADAMGLIPEDVTAEVRASGVQDSTANVLKLNDSIMLLNGKTVTVKEEGADPSRGRVQKMDGAIFGLQGKTVTVTEIGTNAAGDRVVRFGGKVYALQGKTVDINANTGQATSAIAGVQSQLNMLTDKSVTLTTTHRNIYQLVGGAPSTSAPGVRLDGRADGGIDLFGGGRHVQAFANGGTFDPRQPWDTTLGRMQPGIKPVTQRGILMAEEGAGPWEAFISGHPAKKDRSEAIWLETGKKLGLIEAFANGGVYGNWQAELRNVQRLKGRYRKTIRFEDGSSKSEDPIVIFEDGTARWQGYYGAPASVSSAIARLNAAQDRYEAEKRRPKGQHTPEYYAKRNAQQERARTRAQRMGGSGDLDDGGWPGSQHSEEYKRTRRGQLWRARTREDRMARARAERWGLRYQRSSNSSSSTSSTQPRFVGFSKAQVDRLEKAVYEGARDGIRDRQRAQSASVYAKGRTGSGRL